MFNKFGKKQETDGKGISKAAVVKELVLFFGELVKASVEGVIEFWGNPEKPEATEQNLADEAVEEIAELCEETVEDEELVEGECSSDEDRVCAKELRRQARMIKKMAKRAKREERRIRKSEKKLRKQEKKALKAEKKQEKAERKAENAQEKMERKAGKASRKADYVSKNMILSGTEKRFYDGIKSAVGLRYMVKPRVALSDVLRRGDGSKCKDEQLGEMDFGVFDLQMRLRVLVEIQGLKRRGRQSKKMYKRVHRLCKKAGIPIVTFWAKYGVLPEYIKERMQDYLNL